MKKPMGQVIPLFPQFEAKAKGQKRKKQIRTAVKLTPAQRDQMDAVLLARDLIKFLQKKPKADCAVVIDALTHAIVSFMMAEGYHFNRVLMKLISNLELYTLAKQVARPR